MSLRYGVSALSGLRFEFSSCRALSTVTSTRSNIRVNPHTRDKRPIIQKQRNINEAHEKAAAELNLPWRIVGAS
jgi:hypothetical protein